MTASDDAHERTARLIGAHLEAIRQTLRRSAIAAARRSPVPLTAPQVQALQVLVDEQRATAAGLTLTELSRRMKLAHSTVAGIVTRLERRGLLQRTPRPDDRRYVQIELTAPVKRWLEDDLAAFREAPLVTALRAASPAERDAILTGLATLQRLLDAAGDHDP